MTTFEELERRIAQNPFFVLGLSVTATPAEIQREAQRLLGMLALGLSQVTRYDTPLGPRLRTEELVREAMATLLDPDRRIACELWALAPVSGDAGAPEVEVDPGREPLAATAPFDALAALGWGDAR